MIERKKNIEDGFVTDTVGAMQSLFVGLGVLVLTIILVGILGGKAYNAVQTDIANLTVSATDHNDTTAASVQSDVNSGIVNTFEGLNQASTFLPLIVLAIVFGLILYIIGGGYLTGNKR